MSEQIFNGDHYATSYNGSGSGLSGIPRGALAAGTPSSVVINDGAGLLSSSTTLSTALGGLGVNSSGFTGVAKVSAGTWSASAIVDADVSAGAAIARSKMAAGSPNYVLINGVSGGISEEQYLSAARGGTGIDLSGHAGPSVLTAAGGVVGTLSYSATAAPSTIALRDPSGNITAATLFATSVQTPTITAAGDITINPSGGDVFLSTNLLHMTPSAIAGGDTYTQVGNIETIGAVNLPIVALTLGNNRVYSFIVNVAFGAPSTGHSGGQTFTFRAKNIGGVVSTGSTLQKTVSTDAGVSSADVSLNVSGASVQIVANGVVGLTIRWVCSVGVVEQAI